MKRKDLARVAAAVILGTSFAVVVPQMQVFGSPGDGHGCAVGHHSVPVGQHSKPCPTPPGCAIGLGGPVGNRSKPCPTPPGCAIGLAGPVGNRSKPCPTPPGHQPKPAAVAASSTAAASTTTSHSHAKPLNSHPRAGH